LQLLDLQVNAGVTGGIQPSHLVGGASRSRLIELGGGGHEQDVQVGATEGGGGDLLGGELDLQKDLASAAKDQCKNIRVGARETCFKDLS